MKKQLSPLVLVAALMVVVGVLGYIGYRATQPEPVQGMDRNEFKKRMGEYADRSQMRPPGGGGGGMGGYPGGGGQPVPPPQKQ